MYCCNKSLHFPTQFLKIRNDIFFTYSFYSGKLVYENKDESLFISAPLKITHNDHQYYIFMISFYYFQGRESKSEPASYFN